MPRPSTALQFRLSDFVGENPPLGQLEFIEAPEQEVCFVAGFGA